GDEPQPSGEVATLAERVAFADGSHDCAGDDGPDPGHAHQSLAAGIPAGDRLDLARQALDALIKAAPVASEVLDDMHHPCRQDIGRRGEDAWQLGAQEPLSLPNGDSALQQKGSDLVHDAGALADQPFTHPMQRLQVELIGSLRRHEFHRWALHRLGDRFRVAEVVLLSLRIRANVLGRHQPGIVTKTLELATEMMCPDPSLHPDQAGRHVRQPRFYLAPRPPLPQDNGSTLIEAYDMERVLPDIDAHYGDRRADLLGHGVLLGFGAPSQLRLLAGQEHGRTIPLPDLGGDEESKAEV